MHICFNSLDYPSALGGGGVGNQVWLLARALVKAGHKVSVIALMQKSLPMTSDDHGVRVYRVACGNIHWYLSRVPLIGPLFTLPIRQLERSWATWRRIRDIHRTEPIDLVEGTETGMLFVALWLASIPFLARLHGEPYTFHKYTPGMKLHFGLRLSRVLQLAALRRAKLLISPSIAHGREVAHELGRGCPPVEVVPNILASEMLNAGTADRHVAESLPDCRIKAICGRVVLYVGRLELNKGIPTLLAAARRVLADFPDAHIVLAGSMHPAMPVSKLNQLLASLPSRERVHLLGHVAWRDLFSWYRKAAVCVLPSHYETFGLAALEPMAFGVPVVATTAGGLPEVVKDNVSGLLITPGDEEALADALARLLSDEYLRRRLGAGAEAAAARHARTDYMGDNMSLYEWAKGIARAERVFFSPHLDDAVLSCGGLIHRTAAQGEPVRAVTVFAGEHTPSVPSAFARHLHRKWELTNPVRARREEDHKALETLGVHQVAHWDFLEAPYRISELGQCLYSTYADLKGLPVEADIELVEAVFRRADEQLSVSSPESVSYFPLALGGHVDHRLLFAVGLRLTAAGRKVKFYEDWPYAEAYQSIPKAGWLTEITEVDIAAKLDATLQYRSQIAGLGGVPAVIQRRMSHYAQFVGQKRMSERYWHITPSHARMLLQNPIGSLEAPFVIKNTAPSLWQRLSRLFRPLLRRRTELILPPGTGLCVVVGQADFQPEAIERGGYLSWLHIENVSANDKTGRLAWSALPSGIAAAVVFNPAADVRGDAACTLAESYRVLEPGGVVCGSVVLEEWQSSSPSSVEQLLRRHGFQDIEVNTHEGGHASWVGTCLARLLGLPGTKAVVFRHVPAAKGKLLFSARKPAQEARCISAS